MSLKFLSRPEHRAEVSSRESLPTHGPECLCDNCQTPARKAMREASSPRTQRSRVVREAPMPRAAKDALASWGEPAAREVVLVSPFARCTDTMPSVPCAVVASRAAGLQGWRIP